MWSLLLASLGLGSAALVAWGIRKAVEPIPLVTQALPNDETSPCALVSGTGETEQDDAMQTARRLDYRDTSSHRTGPSAALVRTRPMVRRATEGTGEAAYQRLARRTEEAQAEANARVETMFDTMLEEVRGLRGEIRGVDQRGEQRSAATERRLSELELQINMTRDEVQRRAVVPSPSQVQSAKTAIKDAAKSWPAKVIAGCVAFVAIASALNNIPDVARAWDRIWVFTRELDQPVAVPAKDDHKH